MYPFGCAFNAKSIHPDVISFLFVSSLIADSRGHSVAVDHGSGGSVHNVFACGRAKEPVTLDARKTVVYSDDYQP